MHQLFFIIGKVSNVCLFASPSLSVSPAVLFFVFFSLILFSVVTVPSSLYSAEGLFWKRCGRYVCYHYPHCHGPHGPLSIFKRTGNRDRQQPDRIVSRVHMPGREISAPCFTSVYVIVCVTDQDFLKNPTLWDLALCCVLVGIRYIGRVYVSLAVYIKTHTHSQS